MNFLSFIFCVYFLPETAAVLWEETQPTIDQEMDSFQFSSPEVIIAATSMNKCDVAVQEVSRNNKKVFKEPVKIKTDPGAQMNIRNTRHNGGNMAEKEEGKQDSNVEIVEQGDGKILKCQNGRLLSRQEATKESVSEEATKHSSSARSTKRVQAKEKCFGKQLTERRLKKTISADHQNRAQNDHKMKQKFDNLEFGEDGVTVADEVNVEDKSFTRLRSRDSGTCSSQMVRSNKEPSHEGTHKAVKSAPKTRAQKRNFQGTPLSSSCESKPQHGPDVLSDVTGETMNNEQVKKKITKTSQETPIKLQG